MTFAVLGISIPNFVMATIADPANRCKLGAPSGGYLAELEAFDSAYLGARHRTNGHHSED